jgi:hypothetical protein
MATPAATPIWTSAKATMAGASKALRTAINVGDPATMLGSCDYVGGH